MSILSLKLRFLSSVDQMTIRKNAFLSRRPHRSFRLTRRRDYRRSLQLPGYWSFTGKVLRQIWRKKTLFGSLILMYAVATVFIGGITNESVYEQVNTLINQSGGEVLKGTFGSIGSAGLLLVSAFLSPGNITAEQQIFLVLTTFLAWLTAVWLLRNIMAGGAPRLRDGLYNAGSPIVSTLVVAVVGVIQLIPIGIVALIYAGLNAVGLLEEGLSMMTFWVFATLIITLILYWMTSTFLAMVIVTLPGMYPMRAIKAAGDIIVSRRLRVLYRLLWAALMVVIGWAVVMIPVILLDTGLKNILPAIKGFPLVPLVVALMGGLTVVWLSSYIYMLYRRIVDDDAVPAKV